MAGPDLRGREFLIDRFGDGGFGCLLRDLEVGSRKSAVRPPRSTVRRLARDKAAEQHPAANESPSCTRLRGFSLKPQISCAMLDRCGS